MKSKKIIVAIGNDHTAYQFKLPIIKYLEEEDYEVLNFGADTGEAVDYPDFGEKVGSAIVNKQATFGIVICGTGIGISIAANRIHGVRCALCYEEETTRLARIHNDANILALGARIISPYKAVELVKIFLNTKNSSESRHQLRINKLN